MVDLPVARLQKSRKAAFSWSVLDSDIVRFSSPYNQINSKDSGDVSKEGCGITMSARGIAVSVLAYSHIRSPV